MGLYKAGKTSLDYHGWEDGMAHNLGEFTIQVIFSRRLLTSEPFTIGKACNWEGSRDTWKIKAWKIKGHVEKGKAPHMAGLYASIEKNANEGLSIWPFAVVSSLLAALATHTSTLAHNWPPLRICTFGIIP